MGIRSLSTRQARKLISAILMDAFLLSARTHRGRKFVAQMEILAVATTATER